MLNGFAVVILRWACSTSPPSGNQVDGLPLVAHTTGAGAIGRPIPLIHCPDCWCFVGFVLNILLWDLHAPLGNDRYICNLNSDKGACHFYHLGLSLY